MNIKRLMAIFVFLILLLSACKSKDKALSETPTPSSTPKFICPLCFSLSTPQSYPTAAISLISKDNQNYLLIEDQRTKTLVTSDNILVDNCLGSTQLSQNYSRSRSFVSTVELGASMETGLEDFIKLSIASHYQLTLGTTDTVETNLDLLASPGLAVSYNVEWYEEWIEGRIIPVQNLGTGQILEIPYKTKSGLNYIVRPELVACLVTPTLPSSPTLVPSETPYPTLIPSDTPSPVPSETLSPSVPSETTTPLSTMTP